MWLDSYKGINHVVHSDLFPKAFLLSVPLRGTQWRLDVLFYIPFVENGKHTLVSDSHFELTPMAVVKLHDDPIFKAFRWHLSSPELSCPRPPFGTVDGA